MVADPRALERLLTDLETRSEIAIDTEADSFFHYREQVCLIQITAGDRDWLVDPLAGLDLAGLGEVLADPGRVKVFHDGEYDVLILKRDFGWRFANLFDTRVAEAALGCETPGLASVLAERFGVDLDKSLQRSDWSCRPLSPKQIAYARLDTHYLLPLMDDLVPELERRRRRHVVEGECRRLEALEPPERTFDPDEFIRLKGARALSLLEMSHLRELFALRDQLARERDLPPFKILPNPVLLELAQARPTHLRALGRVRGLSPKLARRFGDAILGAIERAQEAGPLAKVPRLPARDGTSVLGELEVELHESLKAWRKERAMADGIDSSLVLNRLTLIELARTRPRDEAALARVEGMLAWQIDELGAELLEVVARFEEDVRAGRIQPRRRGRRPEGRERTGSGRRGGRGRPGSR